MRRFTPDDAIASYAVYYDAVHNGTHDHYNAAQCAAWAPSPNVPDWWAPRLAQGTAWVTTDAIGLTGVICLRDDGYLDMFFVSPRARGDGTAVALYEVLLAQARSDGQTRLTTHASHYLRPFLEKRGWRVVAQEVVRRLNEDLERFQMEMPRL